LQASCIVYLLPPYFENIKKRLTKHPKQEIKYFSGIFENRVAGKQIIDGGELENPAGNIKLLNYKNSLTAKY